MALVKMTTPLHSIALIAIGPSPNLQASEEFRSGWAQLQRTLPRTAHWVEAIASGSEALYAVAVTQGQQLPLADDARVLLLAHAHVILTAGALARLHQALDHNGPHTIIHSCDSGHPPEPAPDYCTLRGLERYQHQLTVKQPLTTPAPDHHVPLATLTTLGTLRHQTHHGEVQHLQAPAAFVHSFADYHQGRREEVLPLIPTHAARVLDVGGGEGGFLQALKQARGCETHLAEYSKQACELASAHVDHVWPGDFFSQSFAGLPHQGQQAFDCITFLDVLEHAVDPSAWLRRARALLSPEGVVVASIPNVGHWGVVADLLEGRWDYCPVGIHCITHLRFFTEQGVQELFAQAGYSIEQCERVQVPCPPQWQQHWAQTPGLQVNTASWDTYAFLIRARPVVSHASPISP